MGKGITYWYSPTLLLFSPLGSKFSEKIGLILNKVKQTNLIVNIKNSILNTYFTNKD